MPPDRKKRTILNVSTHRAAHKALPCVLPYWKGLRPSQTNPNSTALKGGVSTVKEILMNGNNEEWVSKTQMKKRMDELQDLGMELTRLSDETLKKIGLPEDLMQAVRDYKKITSNGALKRQNQYIGRLMRETDPAPIRAFLAKLKGENRAHNAFLQRVEQMRERLIADDAALTEFAAAHPQADISAIRTLIRNTRKEKEQSKPPKNFRALYQELKAVMEEAEGLRPSESHDAEDSESAEE